MGLRVDVAVVGTGVAASTVAGNCREAGRSVAIVDDRPYGGTCVLRGCDPKKVIRRAAEIMAAAKGMQGRGIRSEGLAVDWPELMAWRASFTDPVPGQREAGYAARGIASLKGTARFTGTHTLDVDGFAVEARHIVLATGAEPARLPIRGRDLVATSDDFLELPELPRRILFIGGGYVAFEFAHIAAHCGASVTMLDRGDRPLAAFDADLVGLLVQATRALGVDVRMKTAVTAVERQGHRFVVSATEAGRPASFAADLVVHAAGRVPALERLDPPSGGVAVGTRGVLVDRYLQSVSNPAVYAAGDAADSGGPPLTPVASLEGEVVAANLIDGNHVTADYAGVPSAVFTLPELARVGLSTEAAAEQNLDVDVRYSDMSGWYSVRRVGGTHAAAKTLVERGSNRVLGAHVLAPRASEVINLFALAMRAGLGCEALKDFVSAYPTAGSDVASLL